MHICIQKDFGVHLNIKIKEIMTTIYRAAQKGLTAMNCGSFYTPSQELAEDYVCDGDQLYTFNVSLNLFNVTSYMDITDFDLGLSNIFEILSLDGFDYTLIEKYNGFTIDCGNTEFIILFGKVDLNGCITSLSFDEMLKEDEIFEIIK